MALMDLADRKVDLVHREILANQVLLVVRVHLAKLAGRVHLESAEDKVHQVLLDPREIRYIMHILQQYTSVVNKYHGMVNFLWLIIHE